jgi:hypothetical protein
MSVNLSGEDLAAFEKGFVDAEERFSININQQPLLSR